MSDDEYLRLLREFEEWHFKAPDPYPRWVRTDYERHLWDAWQAADGKAV